MSDSAKDEVILHLEGDVADAWSRELERVVKALLSARKRVVLELSGVRFIDAPGVELLHEWRESVALRNCTLFVNEVLKARMSRSESPSADPGRTKTTSDES
jgi:anti-anti-sigma factor